MPAPCVASISKAAPRDRNAGAMRFMSRVQPSVHSTEEIEAIAIGAAPDRSITDNTAAVQSWSLGLCTVSTMKPPAPARLIHSSTGEE